MLCIAGKDELRDALTAFRHAGHTIGFVPTMGYLHDGHLSLMQRARRDNDVVVVSIFVNPTQFGPNEDLAAYPRDHQRDLAMLAAAKMDIAFFPEARELYPDGYSTFIQVEGDLTQNLCGRSRPGHFRGVATIVAKLFHLVTPRRAYFGQKDAQQVAVVNRMVKDLDMDVDIVVCPTVRESDGLAMSSRNTYLTPPQRRQAPGLYMALQAGKDKITAGERHASRIVACIQAILSTLEDVCIDYIAVVNAHTLSPMENISGTVLLAAAVKIGNTRLIDNIRMEI